MRLCWNVCATSRHTIYIFESIMYWSVICVILSCIFYHKRRLSSLLLWPLAIVIIIILRTFFFVGMGISMFGKCNLCFVIYHLVNAIEVSKKMVMILGNMSILCTTIYIYMVENKVRGSIWIVIITFSILNDFKMWSHIQH